MLPVPKLGAKPSFDLLRRRTTKKSAALSHSNSSASSVSAGTIFRRALATLEEDQASARLVEWRKREVAEGAIASWREEVADEVELEKQDQATVIEASLDDLKRLLESSEVFASAFLLDDLSIPKTPSSPSEGAASVWEDEPAPLPYDIPERSSSLPTDRVLLRLSQQRAIAAPVTPVFPSLYYQFPSDDPSGSLAYPSATPPKRPSAAAFISKPLPPPPPPLSSLPPKAASLLGLLPPSLELDPGLSVNPAPASPSVFSRLPFATPTTSDFPFPRPAFATLGERRGSHDSTTTERSTGSAGGSFWSSCIPGSSMSSSIREMSLLSGNDIAPLLLEIKAHARNGVAPRIGAGPTAAFGAQRRRDLEEQHGLSSPVRGTVGVKMTSYPASPRSATERTRGRSRAHTTMASQPVQLRGRSEGRMRAAKVGERKVDRGVRE